MVRAKSHFSIQILSSSIEHPRVPTKVKTRMKCNLAM